MISAHLIVDIAFCVGFAFVFNPARKFVGRFLRQRLDTTLAPLDESVKCAAKFGNILAGVSSGRGEVDHAVGEVLRSAEDQCKNILSDGRRELESMLEAQIGVATEKIEVQIESFVKTLRLAAVDAASGMARNLIRDYDGRDSDGSASSMNGAQSDDTIKKLH